MQNIVKKKEKIQECEAKNLFLTQQLVKKGLKKWKKKRKNFQKK